MTAEDLMCGMSALHLRFRARAREAIVFHDQPGTAIRGALYEALATHYCSEREGIVTAGHQDRCPVCWLLAAEDPLNPRGRNLPRPITVEPPSAMTVYRGQELRFGITLIGSAQNLMPYVVRAAEAMGQIGLGKGRGRFTLEGISEYNPLYGAERDLMRENFVQKPTLQVTAPRINEIAAAGDPQRVTFAVQSPLRLIAEGKLMKQPNPAVFMARLLERCQSLAQHYAEAEPADNSAWRETAAQVTALAGTLTTAYDDTLWIDVFSGSKRTGRASPIGGWVGTVRWEGDVLPLRAWLLWGQSLHVGKDCVKGNGWYQLTN
jgi:hypothetical protein